MNCFQKRLPRTCGRCTVRSEPAACPGFLRVRLGGRCGQGGPSRGASFASTASTRSKWRSQLRRGQKRGRIRHRAAHSAFLRLGPFPPSTFLVHLPLPSLLSRLVWDWPSLEPVSYLFGAGQTFLGARTERGNYKPSSSAYPFRTKNLGKPCSPPSPPPRGRHKSFREFLTLRKRFSHFGSSSSSTEPGGSRRVPAPRAPFPRRAPPSRVPLWAPGPDPRA